MGKRVITAAIAAIAAAASAQAAPLSDLKYFAYFYNPGYHHYVMLSRTACSGKVAASNGWRQASITSAADPQTGSCWIETAKSKMGPYITVCLQNSQGEPVEGGCQYVSKEKFLDTASLPAEAKF